MSILQTIHIHKPLFSALIVWSKAHGLHCLSTFNFHHSALNLQLSTFIIYLLSSCTPEPPLHLYDSEEAEMNLPLIDLDLNVYWDYEMAFGIDYDWRAEWYYGWDEEDRRLWGEIGYVTPNIFNLRRYYTATTPYAPHTSVLANTVEGTHFQGRYEWGFWDILVWNQVNTLDGVQSLIFDEQTSLDSVIAYTNPSMRTSRHNAPNFTHAFWSPEPLFAAYDQAIEINQNLDGFTFDEERQVWVRTLSMILRPITYIYLTQVIIHNNRGRVTSTDGEADLSGMARSTNVNTGLAGSDAITVYYNTRMKYNVPMIPYKEVETDGADDFRGAEVVDIVGGRLMTFGICNHNGNIISRADDVQEPNRHYMDINLQFNNGMDSTLVFDVTDQVRQRYKGGVITVELDMDTVPLPNRRAGSGFNAVVEEPDSVTYEFDM